MAIRIKDRTDWYKDKPWEEPDMTGRTKWHRDVPWEDKRSKYGNRKTEVDGISFASRKEANYYEELKLLKRGHVVKDFHLQVPFVLLDEFTTRDGKKMREVRYVADFVVNYEDGHQEVVDVKSEATKADKTYRLKKKMLLKRYPDINFVEV